MDVLRELELRFNGIKNSICQYTYNATIINDLDCLEKSLLSHNIEEIKFSIENIHNWYVNHITSIQNNRFCDNVEHLIFL